jgi:hypothetical protein
VCGKILDQIKKAYDVKSRADTLGKSLAYAPFALFSLLSDLCSLISGLRSLLYDVMSRADTLGKSLAYASHNIVQHNLHPYNIIKTI